MSRDKDIFKEQGRCVDLGVLIILIFWCRKNKEQAHFFIKITEYAEVKVIPGTFSTAIAVV